SNTRNPKMKCIHCGFDDPSYRSDTVPPLPVKSGESLKSDVLSVSKSKVEETVNSPQASPASKFTPYYLSSVDRTSYQTANVMAEYPMTIFDRSTRTWIFPNASLSKSFSLAQSATPTSFYSDNKAKEW